MKNIFYILLNLLFFTQHISGQTIEPGELNGKVIFVSVTTQGTITVNATGLAKNKKESLSNAAAGAIYTLLFRGVSGSPYELPMISNEGEKKNDPNIIALLKGGYKAYIIENILISEENKKRKQDGAKGKQTVNRITINCDALRRHLEETAVIRKFGI